MDERDAKSLAVKLAAVTDRMEQKLDAVTRETLRASQTMGRQATEALSVSGEVSDGVRRAASEALSAGTASAVGRLGEVVRNSELQLERAAQQLEGRMVSVGRLQSAFAWKAFIASAVGCVAMVGAAGYAIWEARQASVGTRWVRQINAAQAAGRLAQCPGSDGHVCAKVDKRWVRLDP